MSEAALTIRIEGPGKNALGQELMSSLLAQVQAAGDAPLLLTGAGGAFSAGLNLKEVVALDPPGMERFLRTLQALCGALYAHPGPTVARIDGHAIAGGCVLALCCDHRVATADPAVRIGLNEVALGLRFPPPILRLAAARLAPSHLPEVLLGAGLHTPQEALRLGLVDQVAEDPEAVASRRLEQLAAHPRAAYAAAKAGLQGEGLFRPDDEQVFQALLPVWTSEEVKERARAALGRR